jgi:acetolactate synthase-1/2/3 large subunit
MSDDLRNDPVRRMLGGRALAEMLKLAGESPMFGMGGFQLLPFYDAVRELGLTHTLINDERCGTFAADAWSRVTRRVGVVDATLGPGATNLTTALIESLNAGVPLVAIVGDANRQHAWKNMTQEAKQLEILAPCAKEVIRVEIGERVPELVRRAFAVATAGRPGPVILDVPEDIAHGEYDYDASDFWIDDATLSIPSRVGRPARGATAEAVKLLRDAKRPLMMVGGGIHLSNAYEPLLRLAEQEGIPVAHTMSGKGGIACTHPLNAGLFGRYDRIANDLIGDADCLLVVGCKLGEIATKRFSLPLAEKNLIHLEVMAEEVGRTTPPTVAMVGDAGEGLADLADALTDGASGRAAARKAYNEEVVEKMAKWVEGAEPRYGSEETPINMGRVIRELMNTMPADGVLVADGGFAGHWTGLLYDTKQAGRTYVPDRGFASIGYGLPGAIGAQLACGKDRPVVALTGDGGFNMTLGELETARRLKLGLTMIVVNNAASGYVKALQHAMYGGRYQSSDLEEVNYANAANALGCEGIRVEDPGQLADALRRGMANTDQPTVLDVVVTRDPAKMLPAVDNRTAQIKKGDRIA